MFGVVLWSDEADRKAVFWCEDQGDLAFYEDTQDATSGYAFFDAGDMVQFEIRVDRKFRKALNARLVVEQACAELPERLLTSATGTPPPRRRQSATVLPFVRPKVAGVSHVCAKEA